MTVFPIHLCGNIEYYRALFKAGEFAFEIHEHFPKQTPRNRMEILGPNGRQLLIVPTVKRNSRRAIKDVEISYAENWQKDHWKSLEAAYRRSAYFEFYEDELRLFYTKEFRLLVDFNLAYHKLICSLLKLEFKEDFTQDYVDNVDNDFRTHDFSSTQDDAYFQVFSDRFNFESGLSILDVLFNLGPQVRSLIVE
ncbi:MAG: hypothetical protein HN542_11410 [Flavobacteriales bacterium]|jgi:hypothetical protein|nr:hypothetical protein [Flavobacteriales bacterium]NCG29116.1 hypothetical protein [Bacteroidota bacterium]MBT3964050.1 hypothetical protein [Flavobacteriales bacterium]MBT4704733.1 hypothetical protein [Flavobacteriales bacterium]MBT4931684.1 hypothetical protein [Flavobacteriales bacterium]